MIYNIPKEKRPQVESLIKEFTEHIQCALDTPVRAKLTLYVGDVDLESIKQLVCEHFETDWSNIIKRTRKRETVLARSSFMWLCQQFLEMSYQKIADIFGMDHTTVLHNKNTIDDLIETKHETIVRCLFPIIEIINTKNEPV